VLPELGLFPLPIVLLPTERIPLHIFEERYKELIAECLATPRDFGLVHATEEGGLSSVGTRASVVELLERFDDGRMNVVVHGRERFRVVELTSGRSFQTAQVEPFEDDGAAGSDETRDRALELFGQLSGLAGMDAELDEDEEPLSFAIAGRVDFPPAAKQLLLELRTEAERLEELSELLERAVVTINHEREAHERASGNGRVTPRTDG
jgi:Lon protease-like protein